MAEVISKASEDCLHRVGVAAGNCSLEVINCKQARSYRGVAGVYIFFDESGVYYIGETNDIARRVGAL